MTAALKPPPIVVELVIGIGPRPLRDMDLDVHDRLGTVARRGNAGVRKSIQTIVRGRCGDCIGSRPVGTCRLMVHRPAS